MPIEKRKLQKRLHDLNTGVVKSKPDPVLGKRLLETANKAHEQRQRDVHTAAYDRCYEMAIDIRNLSRARVLAYGGFGEGKFLGGGRFVFDAKSRKWRKK